MYKSFKGGYKVSKSSIAKLILFAAGWLNVLLVRNGIDPFPVLNETDAALLATFIVSAWAGIEPRIKKWYKQRKARKDAIKRYEQKK